MFTRTLPDILEIINSPPETPKWDKHLLRIVTWIKYHSYRPIRDGCQKSPEPRFSTEKSLS